MPKRLMQVTLWALVLIGLAAPSRAQSREVTGQFGILGEWALTATVTEQSDGSGHQWIGPLNLRRGFHNSRASLTATRNMRPAWSSD